MTGPSYEFDLDDLAHETLLAEAKATGRTVHEVLVDAINQHLHRIESVGLLRAKEGPELRDVSVKR